MTRQSEGHKLGHQHAPLGDRALRSLGDAAKTDDLAALHRLLSGRETVRLLTDARVRNAVAPLAGHYDVVLLSAAQFGFWELFVTASPQDILAEHVRAQFSGGALIALCSREQPSARLLGALCARYRHEDETTLAHSRLRSPVGEGLARTALGKRYRGVRAALRVSDGAPLTEVLDAGDARTLYDAYLHAFATAGPHGAGRALAECTGGLLAGRAHACGN